MREQFPDGNSATIDTSTDETRSLEERAFLKEAGYSLVSHIFAASKTLRLYSMNNRAVERALCDLCATIARIYSSQGVATMRVTDDFVFINDHRISLDSQHTGPFEFVRDELRERGIEGLEFGVEVDERQLGEFLNLLSEIQPGDSAYGELQAGMASKAVGDVKISPYGHQEQELQHEHRSDVRDQSNRVYFKTVALMGDILRTNEKRQFLQVRKAKRLTQQMVDIIQTDETILLGLTSIKNFDAYTFAHSVNVCILAMLLGDRLRLDKADIARLGVCGLLHDIGKTYVPSSMINSTGKLSPSEWELMKYHTIFGVKELARIRSLGEAADPMFVALQHHVHFNNNGYPQRPGGWKLRLFSRIVTVVDYFDAMTSARTYQKEPLTPAKALRFILEKSGEVFDPFVAKMFIRAMGLYPVGTIVELDSGELAVVTRQNPDTRYIHRPSVTLVDESVDASRWVAVDLTERESGEYRFKRSVVRTVHDSEITTDKAPVFLRREKGSEDNSR